MPALTLHLTGIAHGGEAFGFGERDGPLAGKLIFTPYAIPGETVRVQVIEDKPRWARGRLLEVLKTSPDRVAPPCPYFGPGRCGGCQWQHIAYERQLALKREVVIDQLRRLGGIAEPPVEDPIALADEDGLLTFAYRNHVQLAADREQRLGYVRESEGRASQGVSERKGEAEDIVAIDQCLLLLPLLDEMHRALGARIETEESEETESDMAEPVVVRRVSLRAGLNTGQQLLLVETAGDRAPGLLVEEMPVRCALRQRHGAIQGLIGDPWIEEIVAGRTFRVAANSFFQVNTVGAEVMVAVAQDMLALQGGETLLDGYCGVGLFGLCLAGQVGQVIAIEESEAACEDFAWNARDLANVILCEGPVAEVLATLPAPGAVGPADLAGRIDAAIIDPPRSGAGAGVVAQIRRLGIPRLLYISCDPATLARDARLLLEAGYRLRQVQPVDLFPQTYHIESMALFTL